MSMFGEIFQNPAEFYEKLTGDQRAAAAQQFQQRFQQSSDPRSQQYAQVDANSVSPQQLAEMHQHAQRTEPAILREVMKHPVLDAALVGFGVHEWRKHEQNR